MIAHLRDLVTCCASLMCSHRVGPEYHICHADNQIPLLAMLLNLPLRRNPRDTFSVNLLRDDDRLMQLEFSSRNSDYTLTSQSKNQDATIIILQREHHDTILLQMILWVMSIMALSTSGMISS
jgi:hypothetical protein